MGNSIFGLMEQKRFETDSGAIVYWVSKCRSGCPLVFLHGLTADHTLFERQIPHFLGRFPLLCWDAPAHGKSRPYTDHSYSHAARALKNILESEQLENAVLIGQSMGGYIAQTYLKLYPAEAAGFIGIDTCPFGRGYYSNADLWWLRQVGWMSGCFSRKGLIQGIAASCTATEAARRNMLAALRPYSRQELCRLLGRGYAGFLEENCDLEITCPTLLLVGSHDRTGKVKQYCAQWHRKTGFPLRVIPNAAHNSNFDNSEMVNREIDAFLRQQFP